MNDYEEKISAQLMKNYRLKIEDANFAKGLVPVKILLDRTRNIHSYLVFCEKKENVFHSAYWNKQNFNKKIRSMLALQYNDLNRPLFFIYLYKNKLMTVEGNDIREALLENPQLNLNTYIFDNSFFLSEIISRIDKEL